MVHSVDMRQHIKFGGDRSNHCGDMANFHFLKMAAIRHLEFVKVSTYSQVRRANMSRHAKLCADMSKRCEDMAIS